MWSDDGMRQAAGAYVGGKSGLILLTGGIPAESALFGLRNNGFIPPGQSVAVNRPIAITQVRVKCIQVTPLVAAQTLGFETHKVASTSQFTGGIPCVATRKKTSDYPPIPLTEIDSMIANTAPLSGGGYSVTGDNPLDMTMGNSTGLIESMWWSQDLLPLVIEQNEGVLVHVSNTIAANAGSTLQFWVGLDFYRF